MPKLARRLLDQPASQACLRIGGFTHLAGSPLASQGSSRGVAFIVERKQALGGGTLLAGRNIHREPLWRCNRRPTRLLPADGNHAARVPSAVLFRVRLPRLSGKPFGCGGTAGSIGSRMKTRAYGWCGFLAAVLAAIADLAMQYTPVAAHVGSRSYAYLLDVTPTNLLIGHFLGVPAVLAEIAGFWFLAQHFESGQRLGTVFFAIGASAFALGAAFHAMFAPIGLSLKAVASQRNGAALMSSVASSVRPAHQWLGAVVVLGILAYSLVFLWAAAAGRTSFPRSAALASPLVLLTVGAVAIRAVPSLRGVLLPCILNVSNAVLFSVGLLLSRPRSVAA